MDNNVINDKNGQSLKGKTILLVNTGSSGSTGGEHKRFIFRRINELGLNVIGVNKEANLRFRCIQHWILSDLSNYDKTVKAVDEFLATNPGVRIDGVVTFYEDAVLLTAKIAERLKLAGVPFRVADLVRNKFKFREFCARYGLPAPGYEKIGNRADLEKVRSNLRFPVVLKPIYGASSAFVIKVEDPDSLQNTYDYIRKNISKKLESALGSLSSLLAEEYIAGDEVDINILIQNGRIKFHNITDNHQTDEPFFIETGMTEPSALPKADQKALIDMADEILDVLSVHDGCLQFEAKLTEKGPVPLEINLRMGGDEAYFFAKAAWGVDLIEGALKIATRIHLSRMDRSGPPRKYLAGEDLIAPHSGVVSRIEVDPKLKRSPYLQNLEIFKEVGDSILAPPYGYEYMGWMAVFGPNPVDAADKLKQALKKVNYSIVKFDGSSSVGKTFRRNRGKTAVITANKTIIGRARIEKIRSLPRSQQRKLHLGVAGNDLETEKNGGACDKAAANAGLNIASILENIGYKVSLFDFNSPDQAINDLNTSKIDLVFNVCEKINDTVLLEPNAAAAYDILQIPYTGSNPATLALCLDKIKFKKLLNFHNIPTPAWDYLYGPDDDIDPGLAFPLIVKPANTDNSTGINQNSVVTNNKELKSRLKYVIRELGCPALVEEYIEGDEYDAFIVGNEEDNLKVLPLYRTIFSRLPENYWHIKGSDMNTDCNKSWRENIITEVPPAKISAKLMSLITEIAIDTYNILDCHDYGLVEIKTDRNNNPYVLELNANPPLNTSGLCPRIAQVSGMSHAKLLEEIIRLAIERYKRYPPYYHLQARVP